MLVAGDLVCQLPQSVSLGVYGNNTMFLTVFLVRGAGGLLIALVVEASDVVAIPIMFSFVFVYIFLYSASLSTNKRSLQSECILFLLSVFMMDLSPSLSSSFTIVCVEVPLLSLESKFHFQKMLATLLFNE